MARPFDTDEWDTTAEIRKIRNVNELYKKLELPQAFKINNNFRKYVGSTIPESLGNELQLSAAK